MQRLLLLLACGLLTVVPGCRGVMRGGAATVETEAETVTFNAGGIYKIRLPGNPASGYRWRMVQAPDRAVATLDLVEFKREPLGRPGSTGERIFTFRGIAAGQTTVVFEYLRPGEPEKKAAQRRTFKLIVGPRPFGSAP